MNFVSPRRIAVRTLQTLGLNAIASDLYYRYFHGFDTPSPGLATGFERIFEAVAKLGSLRDGADYCEFGLFKGHSFWKAQQEANRHGMTCRFFGFDSFAGLPDISDVDLTKHGEFRKGQYRCSRQDVIDNLNAAGGIDWRRTFLIPGYFEESLTPHVVERYGIRKVGVAMIDCDLYSSTVEVLRFLRGLIGDGTVLIMDDWNCFGADDDRGQRRAMREFLETQPHLRLEHLVSYGPNSESFVVRSATAAKGTARLKGRRADGNLQ
jgi:O-methyltransferase